MLTLSHPNETWGHLFLTGMICMICKEIPNDFILVYFVTNFNEKNITFLFLGHFFGCPKRLNAFERYQFNSGCDYG